MGQQPINFGCRLAGQVRVLLGPRDGTEDLSLGAKKISTKTFDYSRIKNILKVKTKLIHEK
jgi:hypothetical protein